MFYTALDVFDAHTTKTFFAPLFALPLAWLSLQLNHTSHPRSHIQEDEDKQGHPRYALQSGSVFWFVWTVSHDTRSPRLRDRHDGAPAWPPDTRRAPRQPRRPACPVGSFFCYAALDGGGVEHDPHGPAHRLGLW